MRHNFFGRECTQLYTMAQINSKERTFADELYQRFNSDKSDRSLIPKDKLEEIIQRLGILHLH
jgi:hypothetical protein